MRGDHGKVPVVGIESDYAVQACVVGLVDHTIPPPPSFLDDPILGEGCPTIVAQY